MPAGESVFEELGVGLEPLTDDRRPFGRLVDFDEEERGGLAGIDDDELVGVDVVGEVGDVRLGQPELDEPGIVGDERRDELDAVECVAERDEAGRSVGVEVKATTTGFGEAIGERDSTAFGWEGFSCEQVIGDRACVFVGEQCAGMDR